MASDTAGIDMVYGYFDNDADIPMSALLNGDTHKSRLVALAGALTDEQSEIALRAIARIAIGRDVPAGLTEHVVSLCRRRPTIKYATLEVEGYDEGPEIRCIFYGEEDVDRDQREAFERVLAEMPAFYWYVPVSAWNESLAGGHWWLLARSVRDDAVVYDRDGDVRAYLLTAGEDDVADAAGLTSAPSDDDEPTHDDWMGYADWIGRIE